MKKALRDRRSQCVTKPRLYLIATAVLVLAFLAHQLHATGFAGSTHTPGRTPKVDGRGILQVLNSSPQSSKQLPFSKAQGREPPPPLQETSLQEIEDTLRLNLEKELVCNRLVYCRNPKTGSSSISYNLFTRIKTVGPACDSALYRIPKDEKGFTINTGLLEKAENSTHKSYIGHMEYSEELKQLMGADKAYRMTSVRSPIDRHLSWMNFELSAGRAIEDLGWSAQLNYISAGNLDENEISNSELVQQMAERTLADYNLILVAEKSDKSLAILMSDLEWRLADVLSVSVNARGKSVSEHSVTKERLFETASLEVKSWFAADDVLHDMASAEIDRRFKLLPAAYQRVPDILNALRAAMREECGMVEAQKWYKGTDEGCMRRMRTRIIKNPGDTAKGILKQVGGVAD